MGRVFFFSSRRRHTRLVSDWSSDVCSSDLSAHFLRCGGLADRTDRPIGRYPFPRGVGEHSRQSDEASLLVDGGGLHGRDLVLAQSFADEVEPARERRIAKRAIALAGKWRPYGGDQRLLRIG